MSRARWDSDASGVGVAGAQLFLSSLEDLKEAMQRSDWVAEDPDAHLLPHMSGWCERKDSPLIIEGASVDDDGVFDVTLRQRFALRRGEAREAVFGLLSTLAEGVTFVHQKPDQQAVFEVTTGMLPAQTSFQSHGHTIRLTVREPSEGESAPG